MFLINARTTIVDVNGVSSFPYFSENSSQRKKSVLPGNALRANKNKNQNQNQRERTAASGVGGGEIPQQDEDQTMRSISDERLIEKS